MLLWSVDVQLTGGGRRRERRERHMLVRKMAATDSLAGRERSRPWRRKDGLLWEEVLTGFLSLWVCSWTVGDDKMNYYNNWMDTSKLSGWLETIQMLPWLVKMTMHNIIQTQFWVDTLRPKSVFNTLKAACNFSWCIFRGVHVHLVGTWMSTQHHKHHRGEITDNWLGPRTVDKHT